MALKIIDHGSPEYREMTRLREQILRRPLGLTLDSEELETERPHVHIGAFEEDSLLGCCMLVREDNRTVRLRQMAVSDDIQRKGIGKALMNFAENIARDQGYRNLIMHARQHAIGFYEKMGYRVTSTEFTEVTIPHVVMEKSL
ncbi:MAG: GNAT family N-acetyltransferase [Bacteroidota bacterium]|jgi:predicted GNAT family N-acyltransferase